MIGQKEYKLLTSSNDFKTSIAPWGITWSDVPTSELDKAYHDVEKGHIVVNSKGGTRAYFYLIFENVSVGDEVIAEMSVKAVNGSEGLQKMPSIGLHMINAEGEADAGQVFITQKFPTTNEWESVFLKHYVTESKKRLRVDFGMYTGESGTFYIKYGRAEVTKLLPTVVGV